MNWSASPAPYAQDTALFTTDGNGQTTVDVGGLSLVKNITFDGASVAAYTIGAGAANSQTLVWNDLGTIALSSSAANSQVFNCALQLGPDRPTQSYVIHNGNPSQSLTFNNIMPCPQEASAGAGTKTLILSGTGPINILGTMNPMGAGALYLSISNNNTVTLAGSNTVTQLNLNGGPNSVLDIGDKELYLSSGGGNNLNCLFGGTINGTGKLRLSTTDGPTSSTYNYSDLNIMLGRTLVINASMTGQGGIETWTGAGDLVLNGINTFEGHICHATAGTLHCAIMGNRGSQTSNLGAGTNLYFNNSSARINYTGTGETTDRAIVMNSDGRLEQSGPSGTLTFSVTPTLVGASRTLFLQGSSAGVGEFSAPLRNTGSYYLTLVKQGSGTWILSATNVFTGTTTVNGGKLLVNSELGTNTVTVNAGATLGGTGRVVGRVTVNASGLLAPGDVGVAGALSVSNILTLTDATLLYDVSNSATDRVAVTTSLALNGTNLVTVNFPSGVAPAGTYRLMTFGSRSGTGTFQLAPAYANAALVLGSSSLDLVVAGDGANAVQWKGDVSGDWDGTDLNWRSNATAVAFSPGDVVSFDDSASLFTVASAAPVAPGGVFVNNSANAYTFDAAVGGSATLVKLGSGALTLTGANTYQGPTTVANGTLTLSGAGSLGADGNYKTNFINNGAFVFASSVAQTNSGALSGGGTLTASGSGSLTLAGNNSYAGYTIITNGGTLRAVQASALGATAFGTYVSANSKLELVASNNTTYAGEPVDLWGTLSLPTPGLTNTFGGAVTLQDNAVLSVAANALLTLTTTTPIIESNTVTKTGSGTLRFTGDPNHRAVVYINEGAVELQHGGYTDAPWVIGPAGTLRLMSGAPLGDNYTITANGTLDLRVTDAFGGLLGSGLVTNSSGSAVTVTVGGNNQSGDFSGVLRNGDAATLAFAKNGSGVQTLSGANTHSGGTQINAGQLNINHASALGSGAFTIANATILDNTSASALTVSPNVSININGDFTFAGTRALNLGAGAAALNANRTINVLTNTLTIGGAISGSTRSLTKNGAGALVLTGASTYTGATTVNGGALFLNSPGSLNASSALTVNPGALFGGSGTVSGTAVCNTNSLLVPGGLGTIGTLTFANASATAVTLTGATLLFDLSATSGVSDQLALTGTGSKLVLTGANKIALAFPAAGVPAGTYTLITTAAGYTYNTGASLSLLTAYPSCALSTVGNSIVLTVSVPGVAGATWTGASSGAWDDTNPNWFDGTTAVTYPAGAAVTFDDTAAQFSVSGGAVSPAAVRVDSSANAYTLSAALSGTGPLTKQGSATLTLTGAAAYNPASVTVNNSTLALAGSGTVNGGTYGGDVFLNNGTLEYSSSANQTLSGVIAGGGGLTKYGNAKLTLTASNQYAGATLVNAGTLRITHHAALGTTALGTFVSQNGTLELANNINTLADNLDLSGRLYNESGNNTYNGSIVLTGGSDINVAANSTLVLKAFRANGPFTKTGTGWLRFTTDPNGNGVMTVAEGVAELAATTMDASVVVKSGATFVESSANALADGIRVTLEAGAIYQLRQSDTINALSGAGTVTRDQKGTSILAINNSSPYDEFSGSIQDGEGVIALSKYGATGDFTLSGVNTFTGPTLVSGGALFVNSPGSLGGGSVVTVYSTLGGNGTIGGPVTLNAGAALVPAKSGTIGTLTLGDTLALNGNALLVDLPASGSVCDRVAVAGVLTLNGVNVVGVSFPNGAAPEGAYTLMTFPSHTGSGSFTLAGGLPNATLTLNETSLVLTIGAGGASGLTWKGDQSAVWEGANNWRLGGAASTFTAGAPVVFDESAANFGTVSGGAVTPGSVLINNATNIYFINAQLAGTGPLAKYGTQTAYLSGAVAYNPASVLIGAGTLTLANAAQLNSGTYAGPILLSGTLNHYSSANQTFSGALAGIGSLSKTGGGTLTLTAAGGNPYSGGTTISSGTLIGCGATNAFGTGTISLAGGTFEVQNDTPMTFINNANLNGNTTVRAGRLSSGAGTTHTLGTLTGNNGTDYTLTLSAGLNLSANSAYGLTFGAMNLNGRNPTFTVNNNGTGLGTLTLGALSGNNNFTKNGSGLLHLPYAGSRTAGLSILTAGTLKLGHPFASGSNLTGLWLNGGVLDLASDFSVNAHTTTVSTASMTILSDKATPSTEGITHTLGTLRLGTLLIVSNGPNVRANSPFGLGFGATTLTNNTTFDVGNNGTGVGTLTLGAVDGNYWLTKRGFGTLKLTGINLSTGAISNRNGRLTVVAGGASSNSAVVVESRDLAAAAARMSVLCSAANARWVCNSLTFGAAAPATTNPTLEFVFGVAPSLSTAPLYSIGNVAFGGLTNVIVNLSSAGTVAAGTYPLLTAAGTAPTALPLLTMVGGYSGSSLAWSGTTLNLTVAGTPSPLSWATGPAGTWDVNNSLNTPWKDNAAAAASYSEQTGTETPGPRVLFDDAYLAANATVTLNSYVSPLTMAFSNSLYTYTITGSGALGGNNGLLKAGTNLATLATANTYAGGTVVAGGTLRLASGGAIAHGTNDLLVGSVALTNAVLVIESGATVSNRWLIVGTNGAAGAVINRGALAVNGGANVANFALGYSTGGYGYYRHDTPSTLGVQEMACAGGNGGNGVLDVTQGVITNGSYFFINRGNVAQYGQVNVTGGRLLMPNSNANAAFYWQGAASGLAVLNVASGGFLGSVNTATELDVIKTSTSASAVGVVNLLSGGTVQATKIKASQGAGLALVNFDGGTLKLNNNGYLVLGGSNIDRATVYAKGLSVDTDNKSAALSQNLLAPVGNGVTAIPLTANGTGYIGRPVVTITGGGGTNATALADFDPLTGQVTGVTITSPGYSYTSVPTVAFVGGGAGAVAPTVGTVTIGPVASGGLTKFGNGTLTLAGANTYGGGTTISNGTVKLGSAAALPTNTVVTLVGGTLDLNGYTVTNLSLSVVTGAVVNGTVRAPLLQGADAGLIQAQLIGTNGLTKSGNGTLTVSAALSYPGATAINGGTVRLSGRRPGLLEGRVSGAFDLSQANPKTATPLSTRYANLWFNANGESGNVWGDNTTYIYNGFLWNDSPTNEVWSFYRGFDDSTRILINGVNVLQNNVSGAQVVSNAVVNAGANAFELRLGQGTGSVGCNQQATFPNMGVGYDRQGRGQVTFANFKTLADPGDGSLLTLTNTFDLANANLLPTGSALSIASGALLDLGGTGQALAGLSGAGTVSNGTLSVTGTIAPGGLSAQGTLALPATSATLGGMLRVDVSDDGTCDLLSVGGSVTLSGLELTVDNPAELNPDHEYTLVTFTGTRTGAISAKYNTPSGWIVVYDANSIKLKYLGGTLIKVR